MKGKWLRYWMAAIFVLLFGGLCGCALPEKLPESTMPTVITQPAKPLEFPYTLPDSTLVVEELVSYRGDYWEDGSGELVEDVAGIMLYNPTNRMVEFEAVVLEQGSETLYFFVYQLPPMSRCLVLERNKKVCAPESVTECRELSTRWNHQELSRERVNYVGLGPTLTIVNRDSAEQKHITVRYKRYVKEGDYYLGGIAYSAHLFCLQPEEQRIVMPEHYQAGKAKIVSIVVNE